MSFVVNKMFDNRFCTGKRYAVSHENNAGLAWHMENREFGSPFFYTGKTQGIFQKYSKYLFTQ